MLVDAALAALWIAALAFGIWLCRTADRRDTAAARRRLMAELARHNTELWEREDAA